MPRREQHRKVQTVAKSVIEALGPTIGATDTERTIADRVVSMLKQRGIVDTWYYACPALVLLGTRSCVSLSGREYSPSCETVGQTNLITVDLSPSLNNVWGDFARSFYVKSGRVVTQPSLPSFRRGEQMEAELHQAMREFVTTSTTFEELHRFANDLISSRGFENLDFMKNLGHTIEERLDKRIYIEEGNTTRLADEELFTFEPHIREVSGSWGFKREDIYHFSEDGRVAEL